MSRDEEWSDITLQIADNPDDFGLWDSLLKYVTKDLSKISPVYKLEQFRHSFDSFLMKFPLMEQYWTDYAEKEFQLGYTQNCVHVFERALSINGWSYWIWMKYLKFLRLVELDENRLLHNFARAEMKIGCHFHSAEFWKEYLEVEETYNGKSVFWFNILKKVCELPLYEFSWFFQVIYSEIDHVDELKVKKLISETEMMKKFKIDPKSDLQKLDYHEVRAKLKKYYTDVYITTQYKVFELYQFERKIKLEYYIPGMIKSYQELTNWEKYLSFVEVEENLPHIEQLYQRVLVPLANYPQFWLKFSDLYVKKAMLENAKNILYKGLLFMSDSNLVAIQIRLIKIELSLGNDLKARDLCILALNKNPENLELLMMLIDVEYCLNSLEMDQFKRFILDLIATKDSVIGLQLIKHLLTFNDLNIDIKVIEGLNKDGQFNKYVDYWMIILNFLLAKEQRANLKKVYQKALALCSDDKQQLLEWYENYMTYEADEEEMKEYFKAKHSIPIIQ